MSEHFAAMTFLVNDARFCIHLHDLSFIVISDPNVRVENGDSERLHVNFEGNSYDVINITSQLHTGPIKGCTLLIFSVSGQYYGIYVDRLLGIKYYSWDSFNVCNCSHNEKLVSRQYGEPVTLLTLSKQLNVGNDYLRFGSGRNVILVCESKSSFMYLSKILSEFGFNIILAPPAGIIKAAQKENAVVIYNTFNINNNKKCIDDLVRADIRSIVLLENYDKELVQYLHENLLHYVRRFTVDEFKYRLRQVLLTT